MYGLFQPVGIAGGLQSVALFARSDIHFLRYGVLDKVGIECHLLVGAGDILKGEIYQAVFIALSNIKEVVTIHLDVLDGDVVALALFVYYYILVLFICNLYVIYDKLVIFYVLVLRKARKTLKYSLIYVF